MQGESNLPSELQMREWGRAASGVQPEASQGNYWSSKGAVYGGRMVPVIMVSPWGGRTCLCWDGKGTEQEIALAAVYGSRRKDDPTHMGYPAQVLWPQVKMGS